MGPKIRILPKNSRPKDKLIKELKYSIRKMVEEDRYFVREKPILFYAKVSDFRADLFRSSNLFALPPPEGDDGSATSELNETAEE